MRKSAVDRMQEFLADLDDCLKHMPKVRVGNGFKGSRVRTQSGECLFYGYVIRWQRVPTFHIHWLVARRRGAGRCFMNYLCNLADQHKIHLHLYPMPVIGGCFTAETEQLLRFYSSLGFVAGRTRDGKRLLYMRRKPR